MGQPGRADAQLNKDGSFTYTANVGFTGTDAFTYNAKDPPGSITNTVTATHHRDAGKPSTTAYATSTGRAINDNGVLLANDKGAGHRRTPW